MALTLYTNTQSRGVVVDWLILDLGIEVERIEVAYGTEMKSPEFLKLNPFGKVPVLVDGDVVIYELDAICAYLADKFFEKGLAPALNDPKRGLYYRWLFWSAEMACHNRLLYLSLHRFQQVLMFRLCLSRNRLQLNSRFHGLSKLKKSKKMHRLV